ncbi:MAG: hypothetical protein U0452_03580 [Anaerolineae bacterium]
MPSPSPFASDWRDCLVAHYQNVLRNQDQLTESTLVGVLQEVGFSAQDLAEIKVRATMRAEDMGPDFVPDLDVLTDEAIEAIQSQQAEPPPEPAVFAGVTFEETAAPPTEPDSVVTEAIVLEEGAAEEESASMEVVIVEEPPTEDDSSALPSDEEPPDYRADGPQQLSMF